MNRLGIIGSAFSVVLTLAASFAPLSVAKPPAPPPPPPPPRTFSYADANGQPYGGLRDSYTGLVWGFISPVHSPQLFFRWSAASRLAVQGYDSYNEFSNAYWGRSDSDWRLPTKDELVEVAQTGIMGSLDSSLDPGVQPYPAGVGYRCWSSTQDKRKKHAYSVHLFSVSPQWTSVDAAMLYIPVRGPVPE